jgi:two-component system sensor kinase FixL
MKHKNRTLFLAATMIVMAMTIGALTTWILYRTAVEQETSRLYENARYWQLLLTDLFRKKKIDSTVVKQYLNNFNHNEQTSTIAVVFKSRDGELLIVRNESGFIGEVRIPTAGGPYERSLTATDLYSGKSELGNNVLMVHGPIEHGRSGLVVLKKWSTLRSPYYNAALISLLISLLLLAIALLTFRRISIPITDKIEESEKRFQAIFNSAVDAVFTITQNGMIVMVNPSACRMLGYSEDEFLGHNINMIMPEPFSSQHDSYIKNYLQTGIGKIVNIGREVTARKKDGTVFPVVLSVSDITIRDHRFFTGIIHDITELRQAESEVRELSRRVIDIREEERDRISMDIHDNLGTSLSLLKFMIQTVTDIKKQDEEYSDRRRELIEYVDQIVQTARNLSHDLSPVSLKKLGLKTALEQLAAKMKTSGLEAHTELDDLEGFFSEDWNIHCYRAVQECLNNVIKHSQATEVQIHAEVRRTSDSKKLHLRIRDNGKGLDTDKMAGHSGLGLALISQRARMMGGICHLRQGQSPWNGLEVHFEIESGQQLSHHLGG